MPPPYLVAVVEDDSDERTAIGRLLRVGGFEVTSYASAEDFLASPPLQALCLLLDLQLDGMSGFELLRGLRADGSTLPVIVGTARDDADSIQQAKELGCVAYLHKPFSGRALVSLLQSLAAERQSSQPS